MVKNLRRVVRTAKVEHAREGYAHYESQRKRNLTQDLPALEASIQWSPLLYALFQQVAHSTYIPPQDDPDVDLDFSALAPGFDTRDSSASTEIGGAKGRFANASTRARAGSGSASLSSADLGTMLPHSTNMSTTQAAMLQPLHIAPSKKSSTSAMSITSSSSTLPTSASTTPLPMHHSKVSRAFVNTLGKLGRWKRVLNNRSVVQVPTMTGCVDTDEFDLELNPAGDLLTVRGGLEQYLKFMDLPPLPEGEVSSASIESPAVLDVAHEDSSSSQEEHVEELVEELEEEDHEAVVVDDAEVRGVFVPCDPDPTDSFMPFCSHRTLGMRRPMTRRITTRKRFPPQ